MADTNAVKVIDISATYSDRIIHETNVDFMKHIIWRIKMVEDV